MEYMLTLIIIFVSAIFLLISKHRWFKPNNKITYVCDTCDEHHCECAQE